MRRLTHLVTLLALGLAATTVACTTDDLAVDGENDDFLVGDGKADAAGIAEGSPTAVAVLKLANETPKARLASDIGLAASTTNAIAKKRAGVDGREGTADDVRFATLVQLDKVAYVGPVAFGKLVAYAKATGLLGGTPMSATATRTPFSGYYWSMLHGELALGWSDGAGRATFTEAQARAFDACIGSYTAACKTTIATMAGDQGKKLSPTMKFDYLVRRRLEASYGPGSAPASAYAHATKWEVDNHYIGTNHNHRYWESRGYAGKCIGWALSTIYYDEPTKDVVIDGVLLKPADIKGYLAAIYNGAQFFVPEDQVVGNAYHDVDGANTQAFYDDVAPQDFVRALYTTIGQGKILEADMEPGDGVWNYPVFKYDLKILSKGGTKAQVQATVWFADDEVDLDLVASKDPARPDLKSRTLKFELTLPAGAGNDLAKATGGRWLGASVDEHPDQIILGLEDNWRKTIYDYSNTEMKTEVNYPLIKREQVGGTWKPIIDGVLATYYAH